MKLIYLRKATIKDLDPIWQIIQSGKQYLKQQGIDQWQNHYPTLMISMPE